MDDINNKEVNIVELWLILSKYKLLIMVITIVTTFFSATYILNQPNIYKAKVLLLPIEKTISAFGTNALLNKIGMGASSGGKGAGYKADKAILIAKTHDFLIRFINDNNLKKVLFEERWNKKKIEWDEKSVSDIEAYEKLNSMIEIEVNPDSSIGMTTLTISWADPITLGNVSKIANLLVNYINKQAKKEAINQSKKGILFLKKEIVTTSIVEMRLSLYQLMKSEIEKIMYANVRKSYVFNVVDHAKVPLKPNKRNSIMLIFISFIVGLILSMLIAMTLNQIKTSAVIKGA